jgi:glycosyltransferase involved in cell wall biosynthesis
VSRGAAVEVVVVDGGPQRSIAAARNDGLRASTKDLVIFLDADERLLPGGIDVGARALGERPDCAMAYGRCLATGADGRPSHAPATPSVRSGHYAALLRANLIRVPAAIFRRQSLVNLGGFREGFDGAADYDVYLRVAKSASIWDHEHAVAARPGSPADATGSPARMLGDTLKVMRANRPEGDENLLAAWDEGRRNWQDLYGAQLVDEIRRDLLMRRVGKAAWKSAVLLRFAPWVLRRELHDGVDGRRRRLLSKTTAP